MSKSTKANNDNTCKYCKKSFTRESTLASHMCPKKKRMTEQNTLSSRLGFRVYQMFYQMTTRAHKAKTFDDFINSSLYTAFVKFGRYLGHRDAVNAEKFAEYIIRNGMEMKEWSKDYVYDAYLQDLMKKETVEKALERSIVAMQEWAEENNTAFNKFFLEVSPGEATHIIRSGRMSPWVLYLAPSASTLMSQLSPEQGQLIGNIIDPNIWKARFTSRPSDVEFVYTVLDEAGL